MEQDYTNYNIATKPESQLQSIQADGKAYLEPVTMSSEGVFGSIELADPGKDLDQIIEKAKEERVERFLEKYNEEVLCLNISGDVTL